MQIIYCEQEDGTINWQAFKNGCLFFVGSYDPKTKKPLTAFLAPNLSLR
jgi:hypothetical protein